MVSAVGTIGKVYVVKPQERFYYKDASVICFQNINNIIDSKFAKIMLESQFLQQQMANNSKGTTVDTITISAAQTYLCVLPPLNEQINIVFTVEKILALVKKINVSKDELKHLISESKSKILDLAIRGKLVPQDPNDEPASVLLERIRVEKEELIKQGKIKRDKKESVIFKGEDNSYYLKDENGVTDITDDLPFYIPDLWQWAKIKDILQINPRNSLENNLKVSFVPMLLIDNGYSGKHTDEVRLWKQVKSGFTHFKENDVGIAKITPCFENRKSTIFKNLRNGYGAGTTELHILRTYDDTILPQYLLAYIKSNLFIEKGKQNFIGVVGQQRIGRTYIENLYLPIPPLQEQQRIADQIDVIFTQLDAIISSLL